MKILWHSNAPWAPSGYGKQTKLFAPRVRRLGHELAISAFWGLEGSKLDWGGISVYPKLLDAHGNDVLEKHAANFFGGDAYGGLVIALTDIWVLRDETLRSVNSAAWVPVDHEPCQPPTVDTLKGGGCIPIAMSRFGERMLADAGLDPVYVPHGFAGDLFYPREPQVSRQELRIPESAFVVGMVAANISERKHYPQAVAAFAQFREKHPDALLYLHTWLGPQFGGLDLNDLLMQHLPAEAILVCDQYRYAGGLYGDEYLAKAYSAMDVFLNPAAGEGFGVGIIEAQACGTPVVVSDWSAMPELVGAGHAVGGQNMYTQFKSWQLLPDVDEIVAALEVEYARTQEERAAQRQKARAFAEAYEADRVTEEFWRPALEEIGQRIGRKPSVRPPVKRRGGIRR